MTPWEQLYRQWEWALIPDEAFIREAEEMGLGPQAREIVEADLETP